AGDAEHVYTISRRSGDDGVEHFTLALDGAELETTTDPARPLSLLIWHVNRSVIEHSDHLLLLHASGATLGDAAVVMPGDMEVGKTTLVTALVRAGLSYLSDEVVAIDPDTLRLRAFPRAMSLDPGSWPLFPELEPHVPAELARHLPNQWQVPPAAIRADAAIDSAHARLVVFPRYEVGAGVRLTELSRADALLTVAQCAFNFHSAPERNLALLGDVLRDCRCFTLLSDDLAAAVDAIVGLLRATTEERP
ncbi:MAG TPA: hypothetical protein VFZ83_02385, partial [Acidimicrobiia bacterium]|nr:hypothetical protein [Acidimicrobiia bacterium]